ncbi:MAG TPA: 16S rRNA (cytosine(967)-C(5))-methyltransferase RsmB [Chthoniobacterales bacterium]|nr:16S rRNA (cytosine(967)-C(5))-methyltransferase RsmB [Chthoniobacterales bacterium]
MPAEFSSRALALTALREWRSGQQFADAILARLLRSSDLAAPDRAFATELFYGVLRNLTLLDFWIGTLRSGHLDHDARDLLRLGIYQLFLLQTPEHAAVYETVELAGARARSLINAVLRNALRKKDQLVEKASVQDLSVRTSHPQFLIDRWEKNLGRGNTAALCDWNNQPAPVFARINQLKISVDEFLAKHSDSASLPQRNSFVRLGTIPGDALAAGHCYIQDPSTASACVLLDPKPGERVLDACAAPGGKTAYLAELMKNDGSILACDRDQGRITTLQDNLERLGVGIAQCLQHDWTGGSSLQDDRPFDRILVDAPCSNTGVMRRRVDVRWRLTAKDFLRMQEEQLRILRATIPLLKSGGTLVYSTCSIEPEENEEVVAAMLREFPFLKLGGQISLLPFRDGFDGAFAAKLVREDGIEEELQGAAI